MENIGLHRYAVVVSMCTLVLVVAGGLVTSNNAGVFYEGTHRMVATTVGILTIFLAVWIWETEKRRWLRNLGWIALGGVILQGVLGGLDAQYQFPKSVSILHSCVAHLFFATTVAIALFTSPAWKRPPLVVEDAGWPSVRSLAAALPVFVLAQVALGAGARHQAFGIVPHIAGAMVVSGFIFLTGIAILSQYAGHGALRRAARNLLIIVSVQVFLGIAAYVSRIITTEAIQPMPAMVFWTVLHVATGALTMAASVALAIQVFRNVRLAESVHAAQGMASLS